MKKYKRHVIAFILIFVLAALSELFIFNGDALFASTGVKRYNVPQNEDQTNVSNDYVLQSVVEEVLTPLSDTEQYEIEVRVENERKIAEYEGREYEADYGEGIIVNEDGTFSRMVKQMNISLDLKESVYIKKMKMEAPLEKKGGYMVMAFQNGEVVKQDMYCSIEPKIDAGIMNAGVKADRLQIVLLTEDEIAEQDIRIELSAVVAFNLFRAFFFVVLYFTVYILIFAGKDFYQYLKEKTEWVYAVFTLMLGGLIVAGLGTNMVSFDEYVHARSAYKLSFGTTIETTEAAMQMVGNNLPYFNNPEERKLIEAYEDVINDPNYIAPDIGHQPRLPRTETRVYYPMAIGFYLGRVLHMSFATMMELARFGNLLCYVFVTFWAVKKAKGYKMLVAAIGMFPVNVFMASTLSYDMLVNAGLLLGYVLLLNELLDLERKVQPLDTFIMLFAFMVGCLSKPVYIVMSLMLLFLPAKKFENRLSEVVYKLALLGLSGLMIYNIFFPTPVAGGDYALVSNAAFAGDKRNIGTSTMGQLQFVLGNPLTYTKILLNAMFSMLADFTIKLQPYVYYAYMGTASYFTNWIMVLLGVFAALFADVKTSIGKGYGFLTHLMNFGVVAIVFSSMYISYTPVGSETILGVQGRYVIPLFLPFLSCLLGWGIVKSKRDGKEGKITALRTKLQAMPAVYERIIFGVMMAVSLCMTLRLILLAINV